MNRRWWLRYMMHFDLFLPTTVFAVAVLTYLLRFALRND